MPFQTKISSYCFIEQGSQILLIEDEGKLGWKLPGGALELGESVYDAAIREVREETGLGVDIKYLVCAQQYFDELEQTFRMRVYVAGNCKSGELKLNEGEVKKARWFSLDELRKMELKDFFIKQYFDAVQEYLAGAYYPLDLIKEFKN